MLSEATDKCSTYVETLKKLKIFHNWFFPNVMSTADWPNLKTDQNSEFFFIK